ncbi:MAG TPA: hypothetical protein VNW95_15035 [Mucilaginibacter sp.]|jgi:hypothetical protein|nr:hypothetical protein [Mucilaginibacter sp.]
MKMNYKTWSLSALVMTATVTCLALAVGHHKKDAAAVQKPVVRQPVRKDTVYDPSLLGKMESVCREFDFNRRDCSYSGTVNVTDGKDSANTVRDLKFLFCKAGADFYYQIGNTETIHQDGLHVFIQHEQNKVVLSSPSVAMKTPVADIASLQKNLRSEKYELVSHSVGSSRTLSLLNDTHITCKEFSVSYDTVSGKLQRIFTRLSDFGDPLNKKNDRVVDIWLRTLEDRGDLALYPSVKDVLYQAGGKWRLTTKYSGYELIIM